ncbi:MAG TPA: serine hydrolase domain-containing protein, partial [Polyangia bacterium]
MVRAAIALTAVLVAAACGCRSGSAIDRPVERAVPRLSQFVPGEATPQRKAKFEAIRGKLDALFQARVREAHATGAAVGIVLDGELVYAKTFGVRDQVSNQPVDADTIFRIASMTKSFTALAIMKLRDDGRVVLDAPAATYIPELRTFAGLPRDAPEITVRMLLTHASGIAFDDFWGGDTFGMSDDELTRFIQSGIGLSYAPGTRYQYSNLGYALLGRIVERASGRPFRAYVTAEILKPLGMDSTVWEAGDVPAARLAMGYLRRGDELVPEPRPPDGVFAAAGGLYTSLHDYARYVAFNLTAYPPRDDADTGPVRRSTLREMHDGQRWMHVDERDGPVARQTAEGISLRSGSYGYGWHNLTTCAFEGLVQHGGYEPGYFSNVVLLPRTGVGIFVLATTSPVFGSAVLGPLREAGLLAPPAPPPIGRSMAEAADAVNQLLERWDEARLRAIFDAPSLRFSWFASLRDDFARLTAEHGHCHPDGPAQPHGALRATWSLACERGSIEFDGIMTPAVPPRLQIVNWRDEMPAAGDALKAVAGVLSLMRHWDERAASKLFAANMDRG